jgi:hypothetical protein
MLQLQAGLAAWFVHIEQNNDRLMKQALTHIGQVLDRLPPRSAEKAEVCLYLVSLIAWLNTDPWPTDPRLGGPALIPALFEQKLGINVRGEYCTRETNADVLAGQRLRLVILGDPGAGKTWLAMRAARRCAEAALEALTIGSVTRHSW